MSISYCTVLPSFWRSKNSVSPSLTSIVWQSAALGRHVPSPVGGHVGGDQEHRGLGVLEHAEEDEEGVVGRRQRREPGEVADRPQVARPSRSAASGGTCRGCRGGSWRRRARRRRGPVGDVPPPAGVLPPGVLEPLGVEPEPAGVAAGVVSVAALTLGCLKGLRTLPPRVYGTLLAGGGAQRDGRLARAGRGAGRRPPSRRAAGVCGGAAAEQHGHRDERDDEQQGDGPQALLDQVVPDVLEERHHFTPVAAAVGGAGVEPVEAVEAAGAAVVPAAAGAVAVAPAVRPWSAGSR